MFDSAASSSDIRVCKKPKKPMFSGFFVFRRMVLSDLKRSGSNQLTADRINDITSSRWDLMDGDLREQWRIQGRNAKLSSSNDGMPVYDEEKLRFLYNDCMRQITDNPVHHAQADNVTRIPKKPTLHSLMRKCKTWNSVLVEAEQAELIICSEKRREAFRAQLSNRIAWQFDGNFDALKQCKFCLVAVQPFKIIDENITQPAEIAGVVFSVMDGISYSFCRIVRPPTCFEDRNDSGDSSSDESFHGLSFEQLIEFGVNCSEISKNLIELSKQRHKISQEKFFTLNSEIDETINCIDYVLQNSTEKYKPLSVLDIATIDDLALVIFSFLNIKLDRFCNFNDAGKANQPHAKENLEAKSSLTFDNILSDICGNLYKNNACEIHETLKSSKCALSQLYLIVEVLRSTIRFETLNMDYLRSFVRVPSIFRYDMDLPYPCEASECIPEHQTIDVRETITAGQIPEVQQIPPQVHVFLQTPQEIDAALSASVLNGEGPTDVPLDETNTFTRHYSKKPVELLPSTK